MSNPGHVKAIQKLLRTAAIREKNCQLSLRVGAFADCSFSKGECFTVTLIGDTSKCQVCEAPQLCNCLRDQFQSTTNSKRRVSTFLFWKNKLGLNFPVSDEMLRRAWKGLDSCANGIKQGNGQRKVSRGAVCVNPYHYKPNKWGIVLAALFETLELLGMTEDDAVGKILSSLGWDGKNLADLGVSDDMYTQAFEIVCHRVRKMVDSEGYIEQLTSSIGDSSSADCGYETSSSSGASSSGASPRHEAEYFSPSSPPDHFLAHGKSEWIDHDHDVPNGSAVHPELADLNHVLFGQEGGDSGCEQDSKFYVAQQMLPRMQNRLWSAEEQADITMYADSLRRAVEDVTCEDDFMDLAEGDAGEAGLPWATYMSTQVWQQGDASGYGCGIEFSDPTAYGLNQFDEAADMASQYHCEMPYRYQNPDGSVAMSGEVEAVPAGEHESVQSRKDVSEPKKICRTMCRKCKRWTFGAAAPEACTTEGCTAVGKDLRSAELAPIQAKLVPTIDCGEPLEHGDVVAMMRHGHSVNVVKADSLTAGEAECIGVYGTASAKPRVNLVGFVDVAVSGPVRNLDMLYVDTDNAGKATATPRGERFLVGQVLDTTVDIGGDGKAMTTVRCIISPQQLPPNVLSKVSARTAAAVRNHLKTSASGGGGDTNAHEQSARSRVDIIATTLESTTVSSTSVAFQRVLDPVECDQCAVALVSHRTRKALQYRLDGGVDTAGNCGDAEAQFVLHHDALTGMVQLQSVIGDDMWATMDQSGVIGAVADPSNPASKFAIAAAPEATGAFQLTRTGGDTTTTGREPGHDATDVVFCFSLYRRAAVTVAST